MKKRSLTILTTFLTSIAVGLSAQPLLQAKDVVHAALDKNFGVQMSENNLEIAGNNQSILNSSFLPTVGANAGANYNLNNVVANFQNGTSTELSGAQSSSFNAGVNLNYVLFDGFGRLYNYKQLKERYQLSELEAKASMENAVFDALSAYYDVAVQSSQVETFAEAVAVSSKRLERERSIFDFGQTTMLSVLNAEVDLNSDSISLVNAQVAWANSKKNLNALLIEEINRDFVVDKDVIFMTDMDKATLQKMMLENNSLLLQAKKNLALNNYNMGITRARYLPSISANAQYGWNRNNNNQASFLLSSMSNGLNAGATLTWNLFDGGTTRTNAQNTKLQNLNLALQIEETTNNLNRDFEIAWANYQNSLFQYNSLTRNLDNSKYNFSRTDEQFKLGQVNSVEYRQAQLNLIAVQNQVIQAKYSTKLAELRLLQLSGLLLETNF